MVVVSLDAYSELTDRVEKILDDADAEAMSCTERLSHEEVFEKIRSRING